MIGSEGSFAQLVYFAKSGARTCRSGTIGPERTLAARTSRRYRSSEPVVGNVAKELD